jgi:TonB-linked SusC/RagA family outer membrane protein
MKKRIIFMMVALVSCISMYAQSTKTITGTVADDVAPLPGVGVQVSGTSNGVITDLDGNFTIKNVKPTDVLVFTYIGYATEEVQVGKNTTINVLMKVDARTLDDAVVVAVGYGDVRRRDLTGSIGKANMDDLIKAPVANVASALSGRIAGVNVTSSDGGPGDNFDIVIRGAGSLTGSTAPLYVIDGFPQETQAMNTINPNDIESIDVLKDASATAIYGARGANGVIIITTKKGTAGKPTVTYNGSVSVSQALNLPEMMNAYEFVLLQQEVLGADEFEKAYLGKYSDDKAAELGVAYDPNHPYKSIEDYKLAQTYDWQQQVLRTPVSHNHHVAINGNNNGTRYSASLSYSDKQGVIINSGMKRYQGRVNLTQKVGEKVTVALNANYSQNVQDGQTASNSSWAPSNSYMYSVWAYRPVSPTGKDLLSAGFDDSIPMADDYRFNPVMSARHEYRHKTTIDLQTNASVTWEIIKGLKLKVMGGYSQRDYTAEEFNGSKTRTGNPHPNNTQYKGINGSLSNTKSTNLINENTLTYTLNKNKHNFNALLGLSFQAQSAYTHKITSEHITNEEFGLAGLGKTGTSNPVIEAAQGENTLMSYFGRVNYNYDSRYYATLTMRADGSSKFAPTNRWGYFPSGSLAWAFGRESFIKDNAAWLSNGKLRASYGLTGNNRIGNYDYLAQMVTTVQDYYAWNSNPATAYILSSMANETLKWETTEQIDLGLDLGFFDDRIGLTVDYYIKNTKDLLLKADIAASSGFSTATLNVGELKNTGWEITLETVNIKNKNFNWTSSLNFAFNKNTIVALNSGQDRMFNAINWHNTFKTMNAYVSEVGSPAGQMYGYIYEGTYKLDEFDYDAATGKYTLKEGIPALGTSTQPGDPKYRDLVNVDTDGDGVADATDGKITDADRTAIGNGHPVFVGGFTNNFTFYGFDLNIFFQWSYGNDILNANRIMFDNGYNQKWTNMYRSYKDRWTMDNPTSDTPRIGATNTLQYSTRYVEDGSYLKLRNVTLGYTFPKKALKKMNISNLRLYVSAENLGTITKYSGMDPEVSTRHSVLTPGFDWSAYPRAFSASFGVNLTF